MRKTRDANNTFMTETPEAISIKANREGIEFVQPSKEDIRRYRDKLTWEGDLEAMRLDKDRSR